MTATRVRASQLKLGGITAVGNNQVDHTANHTVGVSDTDRSLTNLGAVTAITFTLPDITTVFGKSFLFVKLAGSSLIIKADTADPIADSMIGGTLTNPVLSETYSYVRLAAVQTGPISGIWIINDGFGSWVTL